jgi:hypothetical protein
MNSEMVNSGMMVVTERKLMLMYCSLKATACY